MGIQLVDHLILGVVDPRKYRSGDEQVFLSMWGSGYFKKHVFPAVAGQTVSDYSPEVAVAIRRQKRLPGKGRGEKRMLREGPPAACHYQTRKEELL